MLRMSQDIYSDLGNILRYIYYYIYQPVVIDVDWFSYWEPESLYIQLRETISRRLHRDPLRRGGFHFVLQTHVTVVYVNCSRLFPRCAHYDIWSSTSVSLLDSYRSVWFLTTTVLITAEAVSVQIAARYSVTEQRILDGAF